MPVDYAQDDADAARVAACKRAARVCAWVAIALGASVLIGWAVGAAALKSVLPGLVSMTPNTAVGFVLAGGALLALGQPGWRRGQLFLAASLLLLGLATLAGHLFFGADFGIDRQLFSPLPEPGKRLPTGRMANATAVAFACSGLALAPLVRRRGRFVAQTAALASLFIGLLALLGYAFGTAALYDVGAYSSVALHTAVGLVVVNLGILLARPRSGIMAVITSTTAGGVMARRLLPVVLVAPFLIGWLRIQGQYRGMYATEFGIALISITYMTLFSLLVWRTAADLRRSERRRLAADLAQADQSAQLDGIVTSVMDGIIMIDAEQRIIVFNPAAERIFGYPADDVLGRSLTMLLPPGVRERHAEWVRAFGASTIDHLSMSDRQTITGLRANGEEFPIDVSIAKMTVAGSLHYVAILRDITRQRQAQQALQESEQRYRTLAAGTFEGVAVSQEGRYVDLNAQLARMLGYERSELIGRPIADTLPPAAREQVLANIQSGADSSIEHEMLCQDGSRRLVVAHGQTIVQEGHAVRLTAIRDITEQRHAEAALRAAVAEAERANDAKSRFLAAASHDLRQPLAAIKIYAGAMKGELSAAGQPMLSSMKTCIASLSDLLDDLLELSKLDAGVVQPKPSDFPLTEVLMNLESVHTPEAQLKGLRLHCRPTRWAVRTDPLLLGRILGNFVANAIRYTEHGGVLVGCRRRDGKVWVEVWDTGIGIPPDKIDEVFEEFRQLDGGRSRGSGLGLAIVARTATLLGLQIRVRSQPGRGSLFAIEVPLGHCERTQPMRAADAGARRPLRIALVEDNNDMRHALYLGLRLTGHAVAAAASGAELQQRLSDGFVPDVVLSDYRLGAGETGYDVIAAVRAAVDPELPALIITGETDPGLVRSMADRGIVVLHKPVDLETLQAQLAELTINTSPAAAPPA